MEGLNSRGVRSRLTPPRKVRFPVEQEEVDVQSRRGLGRFHLVRTVITEDVMEKVAGRASGGYVQEGQGDYF